MFVLLLVALCWPVEALRGACVHGTAAPISGPLPVSTTCCKAAEFWLKQQGLPGLLEFSAAGLVQLLIALAVLGLFISLGL